jgi:Tfp pilus assembly protein PilP
MMLRLTCTVAILSAIAAAPGYAQAATNKAAAPAATAATTPAKAASSGTADSATTARPDERAAYEASGRRDPFVSLLARGDAKLPTSGRPGGVKGLMIGDLSVRGVLRSHGKLLAIVQSPDNKTYTVHPGDALFDGSVKVVATDAVIFLQRVDDPLSPVKQREIRKSLRISEETR